MVMGKIEKRLLAFVYEENQIFLHLDSEGVDLLIKELEYIKTKLAENDCPHTHLFSSEWGGWELSSSRVLDGEDTGEPIHHLKIFGWNEEWANKHGFDRSIE
jgi:hypothetical protein